MKKKNGMTMVEIMISVALISLVMIFVFNILVDLRQEETFSSYKSSDQLNRSIITKTVQDDLLNRGGVADIVACNRSGLRTCVQFHFKDGKVGYLKVASNYITYTDGNGNLEKWTLNTGTYSDLFNYCYSEVGNRYVMRLYFPVDLKENALESKMNFDIEILYMALKPAGLNISNRASALGVKSNAISCN